MMNKPLVSIAILGTLLTQGVAAGLGIQKLGWPFTDYPMYSWAHNSGEKIDRYGVFGVLEDGTEVFISPEDLRLNFWEYLWGIVDAIQKNKRDKLDRFLALDAKFNGRKLAAVRLESRPVLFTAHSAEEQPAITVRTIRLEP